MGNKRHRRNVTLLATILGLTSVVSSGQHRASAQTVGFNARIVATTFGEPPPSVTGIDVVLRCFQNGNIAAETTQSLSLAFGAEETLVGAIPNAPSTSCRVSGTLVGADAANGETLVAVRSQNGTPPQMSFAGFAPQMESGYVPLTQSTNFILTGVYRGSFVVGVSADSVSPTGEPFDISVACDQAGPKDVFPLKPGERRVYRLPTGSNCLVTQVQSRGAIATYADTSGENLTDGRVRIGRTVSGCPAPESVEILNTICSVGVLITNRVDPASTTTTTTSTTTSTTTTTTTSSTTTTTTTVVPTSIQVVPVTPNTVSPAATVAPAATTTPPTTTTTARPRTLDPVPVAISPTTTASAVIPTTIATAAKPKPKIRVRILEGLKPGSVFTIRNSSGVVVTKGVVTATGTARVEFPGPGTYRCRLIRKSGRADKVSITIKP
jgi:hypothetical protein